MNRVSRMLKSFDIVQKLGRWKEVRQFLQSPIAAEVVDVFGEGKPRTVLILAPCPSEEIIGCGGVIGHHVAQGDQVGIIYCTDGSRNNAHRSRDVSSVEKQEQEAGHALSVFGKVDQQFWRFAQGELEANATTCGLLKSRLETERPDVIYIPWFGEEDADAQAIQELLYKTFALLKDHNPCEVWQFEIKTPLIPNRFVVVGKMLELKIKAFNAYVSLYKGKETRDGILGLQTFRGATSGTYDPTEAFFATTDEQFMQFYLPFFQ